MTDEEHQFDRRAEDANTKAIAVRVKALEDTVHQVLTPQLTQVGRDLTENTRLVVEGNAANVRIEDATRDIVAAVEGAKDLWEFLSRWGGRLRRWSYATGKWIGAVAGAIAALTAAIKGVADIDVLAHVLEWWRGGK